MHLAPGRQTVWGRSRDHHTSATVADIFVEAGLTHDERCCTAYRDFWEPHSLTDPDVPPLFSRLRVDGVRVGVLSNTVWPRAWHEEIFSGTASSTSSTARSTAARSRGPSRRPRRSGPRWTRSASRTRRPASFVGDRLFDDIWGAANAGMRTVHVPHSDIPRVQVGHTEGDPDAVAVRLGHVYDVVSAWRAAG